MHGTFPEGTGKDGGVWSLQDQPWWQQSFLMPPSKGRTNSGACLLAAVGELWGAGWSGQGWVVGEDGAGVTATLQAVVATITAGRSTSPRRCVPQFPQS